MTGMVDTETLKPWELAGTAESADDRFTALVRRHSLFVFRVVFAVLRNRADAEDVAQETFLKLYRLRGWETAEDEKAYLARAAWRMAVERRGKKGLGEAVPSERWGRNPEEIAIAADQEAWIHGLIDTLPEELRLPLALAGIQGLSSAEVGALMDLPEGTVRSRTARARQLLRKKIEEQHGKR